MHRFVWPLRYAATGGDAWEDGVWAPPGRYTVVLEVDGQRLSQPLTVAPDPRISLPAEAYARQFELARRIEEAQARVKVATRELGALLAGLAERKKGASPEIAQAIAALREKAAGISGYAPFGVPPKSLPSLEAAKRGLAALAGAVDEADAAPSPDAVAGFEKIQPPLAAALAAWDELKAKDLAVLNARLKAAGVAEVGVTGKP